MPESIALAMRSEPTSEMKELAKQEECKLRRRRGNVMKKKLGENSKQVLNVSLPQKRKGI